jgi:hypothetical protein|eukprot:COSAG02_NODE_34923_length_476_cov_0.960212_1_plen_55_part_00
MILSSLIDLTPQLRGDRAGIHHKTRTDGGAERHGFPDPTFMDRCTEELAAKGVI